MDEKGPKQSVWHRLGLRRWLGRDDRDSRNHDALFPHNHNRASSIDSNKQDNLTRRLSRRVGVGLPLAPFKRQNSEHRDQLAPLNLEPQHRRTQSVDRRPLSAQRTRSPPPAVGPRLSAPEVQWLGPTTATTVDEPLELELDTQDLDVENDEPDSEPDWDPSPDITAPEGAPPNTLEMELERRWILNLSMHFRDRSEREKFFVTYAETPTRWRRVTISCDYRGATEDSLEQDLKELRYQRDKCARIYESIRESLPEIQFYDTVTNLKVETRDGRLHVHVTEDVNETIPYPPISSIGHLRGARCVPENFLHFESHLSGFVYKVRLGGHAYIKKEIPGPDTVDEFLYEINALHALNRAPNVIQVEAIVVDERQEVVKGLLINYAAQGALVDILYDQRGDISFARRERWAKQIVQGLCEIHESGYVQGDFTLSNIVVDGDDNAHIIDINRRGCPVGWEPPEIAAKIESNQRISMYIGVKTDLYQLGMTLWALAMEEDEPERQPRPLLLGNDVDVPDYYRRLVDICLSPTPRHRLSAKDLLTLFPTNLFSRSMPAGRARDISGHGLRPLVTKSNGVNTYPVTLPLGGPYDSHPPFENDFAKTHNGMPQPIFSDHHDQGKGSTPTLAGSNGGAAFLSRHSSASTLNHHEIDDLGRRWDTPEPSHDRAETHPSHSADTAAWTNSLGQTFNSNVSERETSPSDTTPYQPSQPSIDQDSINGNDHPRNTEPIVASTKPDEQMPVPTNDEEQTYQSIEHQPPAPKSAESLGAMPFLFHSILPINPALPFSRHRTWPSVAKDTQSSLSTCCEPKPDTSALLEHLYSSRLPINPALKDDSHDLPSKRDLFESRLPISPAVEDGFAIPVSPPLKYVPSTSAFIEKESIEISPLVESRLPINPAIKNDPVGPVSSLRETQLSTSAVVVNDSTGFSPLVESRLPMNPAVKDGSVMVVSSPLVSQLPTRPTVEKHSIEPSPPIFESRLPINPAVEDGPMKMASSLPESRPLANKAAGNEPTRLIPTILESQLPLNPTVENGFARCVISPVKSQLPVTRAIDNSSVRRIPSLVESRLPINPASRDYS
ncbi:hypothetical protein N7507_000244 [Penicillium longicatenatum]|nr:hypothetical protein N7507_000244 [Penicillium longicatenatum]